MVTDIPASTDNTYGEYTSVPIVQQVQWHVYFFMIQHVRVWISGYFEISSA